MLKVTKAASIEELLTQTIPADVYNPDQLRDGTGIYPMANDLLHAHFKEMLDKNKQYTTYIGEGFYGTIVPPVIERCFLSNPGWYTAYTPYQAEIAQGRLTGLMIFQELTRQLTGMPVAGASLLDEASAASEAMVLSWTHSNKKHRKFFVDENIFDPSYQVIKTVAEPLGIQVIKTKIDENVDLDGVFGVILQNPDNLGRVRDLSGVVADLKAKNNQVIVTIGCDFASLMLLKSPGQMGADIAYGNAQRFGVPLGFGGPAAAFFATRVDLMRKMPGRIVGMSKDSQGNPAIRMALQTREQHIRREKATSNICTAQALLANMSGFYAVYHNEKGLRTISERIHYQTQYLAKGLKSLGVTLVEEKNFFDTLALKFSSAAERDGLYHHLLKNEINLRRIGDNKLGVSCDESKTVSDITRLLEVVADHLKKSVEFKTLLTGEYRLSIESGYVRSAEGRILDHDIFHQIKGEHEMMRFLKYLESMDISLTKSMITLGSCTMKLNSAVEMIPLTWPQLNLHPYVPENQSLGYKAMIDDLTEFLMKVTSFDAVCFNSNSGAAGEYAGLLSINNYLKSTNQGHRNICLIPASAHGTNPASAIKAGLEVRIVASDQHGNICLEDLKVKCDQYKDNLAAFMVTYPSTHGVYEDTIRRAIDMIHEYGGQVYLDGANMNAQVGLTSPGFLGADVCHLNLHKTFCIPHGGGGPGMGPIGVKSHLAPFVPSVRKGSGTGPISSSEYSSASILSISYLYMKAMGNEGLRNATKYAILNANYMANRLKDHYNVLFSNQQGRIAHEFILDIRDIKKRSGISEEDIAKRLVDYGFHSPTMSFPVGGTLMIEPTESENKEELDRMCDALIQIREEIRMVEEGKSDPKDNALKNAPHTAEMVTASEWNHKYTREQAAYPLPWVKTRGKYWPSVSRIDNVYGDKNLVVSLPATKLFQ